MADEAAGSVVVDVKANLDEFNKNVDQAHQIAQGFDQFLRSELNAAMGDLSDAAQKAGISLDDANKALSAEVIQKWGAAVKDVTEQLVKLTTTGEDAADAQKKLQEFFQSSLTNEDLQKLPEAVQQALTNFAQALRNINLSDFTSQITDAHEAIKGLGDWITNEVNGSFKQLDTMARAAGTGVKDATAQFNTELTDQYGAAIRQLADDLGRLVGASDDAAKAQQQLQSYFQGKTTFGELPTDMQEAIAKFSASLQKINTDAVTNLKDLQQATTKTSDDLKGLSLQGLVSAQSFWRLAGAVGLGYSAIDTFERAVRMLVDTVIQDVEAFAQWEEQTAALGREFTNAGMSADFMLNQATKLGDELGDVRGVRQAYAALLSFDTINKDVFPQLISLGKDLQAQAMNTGSGMTNLASIMRMLGRAVQDPTTAMSQLNRTGVVLDPLTRTLIKHFYDMGEGSKATDLFIKALKDSVGGLNAELDKGIAGEFRRYQEQVELNKAATGSWFAEVLSGLGILDAYTEHLRRLNALRGVLGDEEQLKALKEQLVILERIPKVSVQQLALRQQIAALEEKIAKAQAEQEAHANDGQQASAKRIEALEITLDREDQLKNLTSGARAVENEIVRLRQQGLIVTKDEENIARQRLTAEQDLLETKQKIIEFDKMDADITAAQQRAAGQFGAARRTELQAQINAIREHIFDAGKTTQEIEHDLDLIDKLIAKFNADSAEATANFARGLTDATAGLQDQARALNMNSVAAAAYVREQQLIRQANEAGQAVPDNVHQLALEWAQAGQNLKVYANQLDIAFESETLFFSDTERRIAEMNRQIYGPDWQAHMRDAEAEQIRLNELMKTTEGIASDFATGFVNDLLNATTAVDALNNALKRLAEQLIDMAINAAIRQLFAGLQSAFGIGGAGGVVAPTAAAGASAPLTGWGVTGISYGPGGPVGPGLAMGGVIPGQGRQGILTRPTIFPAATGLVMAGEAGPEGVLPLKRGSSGKLGVDASGMGVTNNITIVNKAPDTSATKTQQDNSTGGMDIEVVIDQLWTKNAARPGSGTNRLLGKMGANLPATRR
jgi:DNA repair exonuclease SbcCD ATPase subunit